MHVTNWSINVQDGAHFGFEKPARTLEDIIAQEQVRAPSPGERCAMPPSASLLFRRRAHACSDLRRKLRAHWAFKASLPCSIRKHCVMSAPALAFFACVSPLCLRVPSSLTGLIQNVWPRTGCCVAQQLPQGGRLRGVRGNPAP